MRTATHRTSEGESGFTLLEVLIALVVLSVGLLGIAAMMNFSLKANDSAYMRSQATALSYDIVDKMRANETAALDNDYNISIGQSISSPPNCVGSANSCTPAQLAQYDVNQWKQLLDSSTGGMPCGDGSVSLTTSNGYSVVTVTIQWDDSRAQHDELAGGASSGSPGNCQQLSNPLQLTTTTVL